MEVLIALGIFALGLTAVAAVFPTAIAIQRETVRNLDGQRVAANARATLLALTRTKDPDPTAEGNTPDRFLELSYLHDTTAANRKGTLTPYTTNVNSNRVQPMINQPLLQTPKKSSSGSLGSSTFERDDLFTVPPRRLLSLDVRSYPSNIEDPDRRDYYWFPLIQVTGLQTTPSWQAFIMVMRRTGSEDVPEVRRVRVVNVEGPRIVFRTSGVDSLKNDDDTDSIPDLIQPGDSILADDGRVHKVIIAEGNDTLIVDSPVVGTPRFIYYAVPIDRVTGDVKRESRSPIVLIDSMQLIVRTP